MACLVCVWEEIGDVAGPGREVGVVGVSAWSRIGALDEVSGEDFLYVREVYLIGWEEDEPGNDAPTAYMKISTSVIIRNAASL